LNQEANDLPAGYAHHFFDLNMEPPIDSVR
jgi:hypothetical protein